MTRYFYYRTNNGGRLPVVMNEDGSYTIYNQKNRKPLQSFTNKMIRSFGKNGLQVFQNRCEIARVKDLEDLFDRMDKADKLLTVVIRAQNELYDAKKQMNEVLYPELTYADTKAMGCTAIVYWQYESLTNPETGNEFFRPEEAKKILENRKKEYFEKYKNELEEKEKEHNKGNEYHFPDEIEDINDSCYIWENAVLLEDLVWQEEKGLLQK